MLKSLHERWKTVERFNDVGWTGAARRIVEASVSGPAQPDRPNAERLAVCDVSIHLVAHKEHVVFGQATASEGVLKEFECRLTNTCVN